MVDYRCMLKDFTIKLLSLPENNNPKNKWFSVCGNNWLEAN